MKAHEMRRDWKPGTAVPRGYDDRSVEDRVALARWETDGGASAPHGAAPRRTFGVQQGHREGRHVGNL
jgi:hypothetical protein